MPGGQREKSRQGLCSSGLKLMTHRWLAETSIVSCVVILAALSTGFRYSGWGCLTQPPFCIMLGIPAASITATASAATAAAGCSSWRLVRAHKLIMLGFLGWSEGSILRTLVPFGFDMGTGINFVLCGLVSVMVVTAAVSTTSTPGTTLSIVEMPLRTVPGLS